VPRNSGRTTDGAVVGVADHAGWAIVMTATRDGAVLDRRRIELVDAGLPTLPYHHDAQKLPVDQASALIDRVRVSAEEHARRALDALTRDVALPIFGIAIRECPPLPPTIPERLANYRAQNVADTVMYRRALAEAAAALGWMVHWYTTKKVFDRAGAALGVTDIETHFSTIHRAMGRPWRQDHKIALAAAIAASSTLFGSSMS